MTTWEIILTITGSVFASGGFWSVIQSKINARSSSSKLLLGLAYREIINIGNFFIERYNERGIGMTTDEYKELTKYLVEPYHAMGGDGTVDKLMEDIKKIPIYSNNKED